MLKARLWLLGLTQSTVLSWGQCPAPCHKDPVPVRTSAPTGRGDTAGGGSPMLCFLCSPPNPEAGPYSDTPTMKVLLSTLWLAVACSPVHTTLSKSDAKKAASKTLLEKVGVAWGLRARACEPEAEGSALGDWSASPGPRPGGLVGSSVCGGAGWRVCPHAAFCCLLLPPAPALQPWPSESCHLAARQIRATLSMDPALVGGPGRQSEPSACQLPKGGPGPAISQSAAPVGPGTVRAVQRGGCFWASFRPGLTAPAAFLLLL